MTEIPEWINAKISFDRSRDVQDRHIVEVFIESDRPYLSRRRVAADIGLTKEGTRPRLENLEEIGVLDGDTVAGGRIHWVHNDRSDWPIPPDVEVEPVSDELSVNELMSRNSSRLIALGAGLTMFGALFMVAFTLVLAYEIGLPFWKTSDILLGGVLLIFSGYSIILGGFGSWIWERYVETGNTN